MFYGAPSILTHYVQPHCLFLLLFIRSCFVHLSKPTLIPQEKKANFRGSFYLKTAFILYCHTHLSDLFPASTYLTSPYLVMAVVQLSSPDFISTFFIWIILFSVLPSQLTFANQAIEGESCMKGRGSKFSVLRNCVQYFYVSVVCMVYNMHSCSNHCVFIESLCHPWVVRYGETCTRTLNACVHNQNLLSGFLKLMLTLILLYSLTELVKQTIVFCLLMVRIGYPREVFWDISFCISGCFLFRGVMA